MDDDPLFGLHLRATGDVMMQATCCKFPVPKLQEAGFNLLSVVLRLRGCFCVRRCAAFDTDIDIDIVGLNWDSPGLEFWVSWTNGQWLLSL